MLTRARSGEDGTILVLVIGYTALAAVLIVLGIDVSKVFLARRALAAASDTAALAAAQAVDLHTVYDGNGVVCGQRLPIAVGDAAARADASIAADRADLRRTFSSVSDPDTTVSDGTVTVSVSGRVEVPFGRVLAWLDPGHADGMVGVTETSHARSPLVGGGC